MPQPGTRRGGPQKCVSTCSQLESVADPDWSAEIWEETGCSNAELWLLDLASFASVKAFAERFEREATRLDLLVENAAIVPEETFVSTSDGWEPVYLPVLLSQHVSY